VPGRTGPPRAPSRWRPTLCIQTEGRAARTRALPLRSVRRGDIRRCTIRRMGGRACGPTRKQSGRMLTGPASAQSRRPACLGNAIGGPSQRSTLATSPYVTWVTLGNIQGRPSARPLWPVLGTGSQPPDGPCRRGSRGGRGLPILRASERFPTRFSSGVSIRASSDNTFAVIRSTVYGVRFRLFQGPAIETITRPLTRHFVLVPTTTSYLSGPG
jgi:hypothetical protein